MTWWVGRVGVLVGVGEGVSNPKDAERDQMSRDN